jgi:hypothetical protein
MAAPSCLAKGVDHFLPWSCSSSCFSFWRFAEAEKVRCCDAVAGAEMPALKFRFKLKLQLELELA